MAGAKRAEGGQARKSGWYSSGWCLTASEKFTSPRLAASAWSALLSLEGDHLDDCALRFGEVLEGLLDREVPAAVTQCTGPVNVVGVKSRIADSPA
ncbi:hypothetical protein LshimejAT787_0308270 [Lyophyllum shimeji]|uniref:Uncharacterized protein n=1 Tax=Lyophyllum shimeji TaxID=47721 RepID=A0A9P3PJE1_LYOSH|nr:hypothetical protein LshimejAT787_0308270 [Lyophyllum shimeji]